MNSYELIFIVQPDLEGEGLAEVVEGYTDLVESLGGQIVDIETWGKRRLAYPIRKFREGYYYVTQIQLEPDTLGELERALKLTEQIIRYLIVRQSE